MVVGIDIVGFGPIGRELARTIVSDSGMSSRFAVASISDSSGAVFPSKPSEVLDTVNLKASGKKLSEMKRPPSKEIKSSVVVDVTNSDYTKHDEARRRTLDALRSGRHLVSANKVALAYYFPEIFETAGKAGLRIGFGATICGGWHAIGIARRIGRSEIVSAQAVLNASTTLILSMLEVHPGLGFEEACEQASEAGVLERDWGIDLDGWDAAAKTAILSNVLFPELMETINKVKRKGLRESESRDLIESNRLKPDRQKIRLVSDFSASQSAVEPKSISQDSPLAVSGRLNAVVIETKSLGNISVQSLGGGVELTASVIISDLKDIFLGIGH